MGTGRVIPNEVKEQILNRIKNEGITAAQAARDAGIPDNTVYGWLAKSVTGKANDGEVTRLKRELQGAYELIGKLTRELEAYKKKNRPWR
jgi:transposase-like protein